MDNLHWKNEFVELLFPSDDKPRDESAADELRYKNRPKSLFKYRRAEGALFQKHLDEVMDDLIWLSRPDQFNDPYELFFRRDYQKVTIGFFSSAYPDFAKAIDELYPNKEYGEKAVEKTMTYILAKRGELSKRNIDDLQEEMKNHNVDKHKKEMYDTVKICCFTERNDSIPMWAHYADNHRGFCIEYDVYDQPRELVKYLIPVVYTDEMVDVTKELLLATDGSGIKPKNGWGIKTVMHKSKDWSYEKEWRFIKIAPPINSSGVGVKFLPVKGIYLGAKISAENKSALCAVALKKNIPIYDMRPSDTKFAFEPRLLQP